MLLETVLLDLPLERRPQLALARDHEARVRDFAHDERGGFDEVSLTFVRHQGGDIADERRLMGEEQLFVQVDGRRRRHTLEVDAFVNGHRPRRRHAVGHEHLSNRFRRADEAVDLPVLPARQGTVAQVEVDAARRDERWLGELRAHRERQPGHGDTVRVVGMDDVGLELLEKA